MCKHITKSTPQVCCSPGDHTQGFVCHSGGTMDITPTLQTCRMSGGGSREEVNFRNTGREEVNFRNTGGVVVRR